MIYFVVSEEGSFSIRFYLDEEGRAVRDRIRVVSYRELARLGRLPLGTWVFTQIDRLTGTRRELVDLACHRLTGAEARVMNQPREVLRRHALLRAAYSAGMNRFRAWSADGVLFGPIGGTRSVGADAISAADLRYPVFVRDANRHTGNLTPLLDSPRKVEHALASLMASGRRLTDLLVVEFCDTKDEHGIYHKYSAFKIGDRVVPRYRESSREWMVKWDWRLFDRQRADEEARYLETNPHDAWIRRVFDLARIDYGRIDYGVLDGAPQVWEINTNPTIGRGPGPKAAQSAEVVAYKEMLAGPFANFYANFTDAWRAVDTAADASASVELNAPRTLVEALDREAAHERRRRRAAALVHLVARQPWVRPVTRLLKRGLASVASARLRLGC